MPPSSLTLMARVESLAREWGLAITSVRETATSLLAVGTRGTFPVVLKVSRRLGDEWRSGAVVRAFDGHGMVRAFEHADGAVLLERLTPGTSLAQLAMAGRDQEATAILSDVIQRLSAAPATLDSIDTVQDWAKGFSWYLESDDTQIDRGLVERGQRRYLSLAASQRQVRLLHGDLQHYNVLHDEARGWLAIDPKGVLGETEYELGASLRNPVERPALYVSPKMVESRLGAYAARLDIVRERALAWAYAQAVLSAIWEVEDGLPVTAENPAILLANTIEGMLPRGP
jgi:streptomycin 6-kinase